MGKAGIHTRRYTGVAIILHWVMALGIGALAVMGLAMTHLKLNPMLMFKLYQLHKSIGVTVLLAAVIRLAWRLFNKPPALPKEMSGWEHKAASATHLVLYLLLIGLPLSGWAVVSVSTLHIPTVLFGTVPWPDLPILSSLADKPPVEAAFKIAHAYGAYALILLVGAHALAALRHHFVLKDDVLLRMLPAARPNLKGHILVDVDLASAITGDSQRDSALPSKDWFDIGQGPWASDQWVALDVGIDIDIFATKGE